MRLLIVNPNSTKEMTERIGTEAKSHLPAGVELTLCTNETGPASIQGAADGEEALPGTLNLLRQTPFDAAIIGCFDDTGLMEFSPDSTLPVVGLGEAAMRAADELGGPFAVLTTSLLSVPVIAANVQAYGLAGRLIGIRASQIDVLDFETDRNLAVHKLISAARSLLAEEPQIKTIVLGCAGMGGLTVEMERILRVRAIDPIEASVHLVIKRELQGTPR